MFSLEAVADSGQEHTMPLKFPYVRTDYTVDVMIRNLLIGLLAACGAITAS